MNRRLRQLSRLCCFCGVLVSFEAIHAQVPSGEPMPPTAGEAGPDGSLPQPAGQVDVEPAAQDSEIEERLSNILVATEWFENQQVEVRDGVAFLEGVTSEEQYSQWAADLAGRTQGVVAVVNRIELRRRSLWDLSPAWLEFRTLWRRFIVALPFIIFAIVTLTIAWWLARLATIALRRVLMRRVEARILRDFLARGIGLLLFLLGLYIVLRVSGLTRLAVTVLGGTGLVGLVIGIAFRDITENFLASIFLSMQNPFRPGDLVEISGELGYVQRLTARTTILMSLDGNHVQIPNAHVYKSAIRNYTSNPNRRESFTIGIGYDDTIAKAQEIALRVLAEHPAVLKDPEPWVLADHLASSSVVLKIYFWLDGSQHSWLKVRSSAIRLVKRAFQENGVSMPDDAREVVFPQGVPIRRLREAADGVPVEPFRPTAGDGRPVGQHRAPEEIEPVSHQAEGGLVSEALQIERQALRSRPPEEGEDLLDHSASS